MKHVRVKVPGIKLKDGKTDAEVGGVYESSDLAMTRFTLNKRIDQGWLEVADPEPEEGEEIEQSEPEPEPEPEEVEEEEALPGLENPNLPDAAEFDASVSSEEVMKTDTNTGDEVAAEEAAEAAEENQEPSQVHPEPARDGKTISEWWDAATIPEGKTRGRACPFCEETHNGKSDLFDCCADKSEWSERT